MPVKISTLEDCIGKQRRALTKLLAEPLHITASLCREGWPNRQALNQTLSQQLKNLPFCKFMYALGTDGIQLSDKDRKSVV